MKTKELALYIELAKQRKPVSMGLLESGDIRTAINLLRLGAKSVNISTSNKLDDVEKDTAQTANIYTTIGEKLDFKFERVPAVVTKTEEQIMITMWFVGA